MTFRVGIVVGGRGKRLMPYTNERPKPLLEVGGRYILAYILDEVRALNFPISLLLGYRGQMVADLFRGYESIPFDDADGGAYKVLELAKRSKETNAIILYGDTLIKKESVELAVNHHLSGDFDGTILFSDYHKPSAPEGIVRILDRNQVIAVEKSIPRKKENSTIGGNIGMSLLIRALTDNGCKIQTLTTNDWFLNINTLEDFEMLKE
jgi:NDP-sugar pyrophosphorylase family protein